MGCDFYIHISLKIEHKNGISYYELPSPRGYFCELDGIYDSDEDEEDRYYDTEDFEKLYEDMRKFCLTPRKDLVIFENNNFTKPQFEKKYLPMLENKIKKKYIVKFGIKGEKDTGNFSNISEIIKVTKEETRFETDF